MFENDADLDFGDDFTINFEKIEKSVNNKRPLEVPEKETPKKQKIYQLTKNVVKRRFPGPAGILPDRKDCTSLWEIPNSKDHEEIPCSQMSLSVFQSSPWLDMSRDFESLIDIYDITWIRTNANSKKLPNGKVPFLAAIIKNIECCEAKNPLVKVVLKDMSGEIEGTILHSLFKEYSSSLVPGSVILLTQCGVTSYNNNHYLNITPKNLMTIYSKNSDEEMVVISVQEVGEVNKVQESTRRKEKNDDKENDASSCGQLKIIGSQQDVETWENILEGVDMSSFFEDF